MEDEPLPPGMDDEPAPPGEDPTSVAPTTAVAPVSGAAPTVYPAYVAPPTWDYHQHYGSWDYSQVQHPAHVPPTYPAVYGYPGTYAAAPHMTDPPTTAVTTAIPPPPPAPSRPETPPMPTAAPAPPPQPPPPTAPAPPPPPFEAVPDLPVKIRSEEEFAADMAAEEEAAREARATKDLPKAVPSGGIVLKSRGLIPGILKATKLNLKKKEEGKGEGTGSNDRGARMGEEIEQRLGAEPASVLSQMSPPRQQLTNKANGLRTEPPESKQAAEHMRKRIDGEIDYEYAKEMLLTASGVGAKEAERREQERQRMQQDAVSRQMRKREDQRRQVARVQRERAEEEARTRRRQQALRQQKLEQMKAELDAMPLQDVAFWQTHYQRQRLKHNHSPAPAHWQDLYKFALQGHLTEANLPGGVDATVLAQLLPAKEEAGTDQLEEQGQEVSTFIGRDSREETDACTRKRKRSEGDAVRATLPGESPVVPTPASDPPAPTSSQPTHDTSPVTCHLMSSPKYELSDEDMDEDHREIEMLFGASEDTAGRVQEAEGDGQGRAAECSVVEGTVYVGDLPAVLLDGELHKLASAFGPIHTLHATPADANQSCGYALVQFERHSSVEEAILGLHNLAVGEHRLVARRATADDFKSTLQTPALASTSLPLSRGPMPDAVSGQPGTSTSASDDSTALAVELAAKTVPSVWVTLTGMCTRSELLDSDEAADVVEDTVSQCIRFGRLLDVFLPTPAQNPQDDPPCMGRLCVQYEKVQAAIGAQKMFNGRKFSARTVVAAFITEEEFQKYYAKYPCHT